jgi:hypothetical protein
MRLQPTLRASGCRQSRRRECQGPLPRCSPIARKLFTVREDRGLWNFSTLRVRIERHAPVLGEQGYLFANHISGQRTPRASTIATTVQEHAGDPHWTSRPSPALVRNGMCRSRRTVTVLLVVHGTENGGIGDLELVEMQNGKHRAGRWQGWGICCCATLLPWGTSLRLSVSDNAND